jgi:hypothetical protein
MKILANKPKEVALFVKFLYLEIILALLGVYDEYDPMTESMYLFLFALVVGGLVVINAIKDFSRGDKDAYKTIRTGSYIIIVFFFIVSFLIADKPVMEYLKIHQSFVLYPLAGIINIMWLNSKAVKDWFEKQ